jgi:hypothetical protein
MSKELRIPFGPFEDDEHGPYFWLPLTQGKMAKISPEDIERVKHWNWSISREGCSPKYYAIRRTHVGKKSVKIRLHRFVKDIPLGTLTPDTIVKHLGNDTLDCRQDRLEIITQKENMARVGRLRKNCES